MISRIQKFYRYFVYRIYHINNNDPEMKVTSFLCARLRLALRKGLGRSALNNPL